MYSILSTAYLPPISYFVVINGASKSFIESCENYTKQSYRNRCHIVGANGVVPLSIPIEKGFGQKIGIRDVKISEHENWQQQHWKSIYSAYRSSPFFEYYQDDLRPFYEKKWKYLWDYNWELMQMLFQWLDIQPNVTFTKSFEPDYRDYLDYRFEIHPKKEGTIGSIPYYQVFEQKHGFVPDMSIVDLLFNMGNEAILVLTSS